MGVADLEEEADAAARQVARGAAILPGNRLHGQGEYPWEGDCPVTEYGLDPYPRNRPLLYDAFGPSKLIWGPEFAAYNLVGPPFTPERCAQSLNAGSPRRPDRS